MRKAWLMCISSLNSRNATLSKVVGSRGNSHASRCTSAWMGPMKNTRQNKRTIIVWAFGAFVVAPRAETSEVFVFSRDVIFIVGSSTAREEEKTEKKKGDSVFEGRRGGSVGCRVVSSKEQSQKKKKKKKKKKGKERSGRDKEKERQTGSREKEDQRDQRKLKGQAEEETGEERRKRGKRSKEEREGDDDQEGIWDRQEEKERKPLIKEDIGRRKRRRSFGKEEDLSHLPFPPFSLR